MYSLHLGFFSFIKLAIVKVAVKVSFIFPGVVSSLNLLAH